jgi:hypothetical protein
MNGWCKDGVGKSYAVPVEIKLGTGNAINDLD